MNLPPLDQIGFGRKSHRLALRFLAAVYCDPTAVRVATRLSKGGSQVKGALALYWHVFPYFMAATLMGRLLFSRVLGIATERPIPFEVAVSSEISLLVISVFIGLRVDLVFGVVSGLFFCVFGGVAQRLDMGLGIGFAGELVYGLGYGLAFGVVFGLRFGLIGPLIFAPVSGFVVALIGGPGSGSGWTLGFAFGYARLYYVPLHCLLLWSKDVDQFRTFHPVFWDRRCRMPFPALHRALVGYAEEDSAEGRADIERLITDYPSQRGQALRAKTVLVARDAAKVAELTILEDILSALPEGKKGYLAETASLREKALAVSRQQRYVDATTRPFFKQEALRVLRAEIQAFYAQVGGYREPLATEFRRAAEAWLVRADEQLARVETQRQREPTPQVFRAGDPVDRDAEAFVPRLDLVGTLESEIMVATGCPGVLVYGRRRLGKSTLLRNLDGFLPESVVPVVISMQNPEAFTSEATLATLLGAEIRRSWKAAAQIPGQPADLVALFQFLKACNERLGTEGRCLILAIDEFEELDRRIGRGQLSADLPSALRESIQSHRRITWMFAGSHHFSELTHVRWSSFLVSVRTIEVPPFTPAETRLLLSDPLKYSRRPKAREALGPDRFGARFWGEGGIERIHEEAGGWPHLVQLVAATAVDLCNRDGRTSADAALLEEAFSKAVVSGDSVLAELMLYRSDEYPDAWAYLSAFRNSARQCPPENDAVRLVLKRHLLVKETDDGRWELRVPLMARWLKERT
jgi:hypothetical protein